MRKVLLIILLIVLPTLWAKTEERKPNVIPPIIVPADPTIPLSVSGGPSRFLNNDLIKSSDTTSLADLLQNQAGLALQDSVGTGSQVLISMRGFGANANNNSLLLLNGMPLINPDLAAIDLNTIPVINITAIEVMEGSESVLYGDQAVGGAINILTGPLSKNSLQLNCKTGSYASARCQLNVNNSYKQIRYQTLLLANRTENYRSHNAYHQEIFSGSLSTPSDKFSQANFQIAQETIQFPGALTHAQVTEDRRQASNHSDFFHENNEFLNLKKEYSLTKNSIFDFNLAMRNTNGNGVLTIPFKQTRNSIVIQPEVNSTITIALMKSGLDFENDNYQLASNLDTTKDHQQKWGAFTLVDIPIQQKYDLICGARVALLSSAQRTLETENVNSHRALATTLGLSMQLSSHIKYYLRRATSFRFPKADEMAANPATVLRTQRGQAYETGVAYQLGDYASTIDLYQLNLQDEIAFDPLQTPLDPFGSNQNLSPTERWGLSWQQHFIINNNIVVNGIYHYVNARFRNGSYAGKRIPLVAEDTLQLALSATIYPRWRLTTEAAFTGNQFSANDNNNTAGRIGGYWLYHVYLQFNYAQLHASFHINNLFDKHYYLFTVYQTYSNNEFYYPAPERNYSLAVDYEFA